MADKIRINSKYDMKGNYEPSDSEDDYSESNKQLLDYVRKKQSNNVSDSEDDGVYQFSESEESDKNADIADSDVEGQENSEDDLPNTKAWGKQKRSYYATDYVDKDYGGFGEDEDAALMEEEEAKNIQKRLLEQLGDEDFSLEVFSKTDTKKQEATTIIKSDLSEMTNRQKLQLLEKESPEFSGLIEDFKNKLTIAKDDLQPVLKLVEHGKLPPCPASKFVKTNYKLILHYCTNISFYLLLKSQRINIQNHPVIKRLYQYRQMINKMEPIYLEVIKPQIDKLLEAVNKNIELRVTEANTLQKSSKKRKSRKGSLEIAPKKLKLINNLDKDDNKDTGVSESEEEYEGNDFFNNDSPKAHNDDTDESGFSDNEENSKNYNIKESENNMPSTSQSVATEELADKRKITYQIAKNKGLTPHRKKDQRNPRVKHKLKYRKAKIRRKGAVREHRLELTRYSGEATGIKANVKKSIKIK